MRMFCLECQHEWKPNGIGQSSYRCPNCGAYDVMEIVPRRKEKEKRAMAMEAGQTSQTRRED